MRDYVLEYQTLIEKLQEERRQRVLSIDEEGEYTEFLDDVWREMSSTQQKKVEQWFNKRGVPEEKSL